VTGARLDGLISRLFSWNDTYHATNTWHRLRPQVVFLVLRRR
jgi:hypothetical protein